MPNQLNVDQWVMVRDRHRLSRLKKGKDADPEKFKELFEKSNQQVKKRFASLPTIKLNQDLPVTQYADQLIDAIQKHQVIIVAGETGSGKTTQLPQIAMLAGRGLTGMIGHTQPRRLAARSVFGEMYGYAIGSPVSDMAKCFGLVASMYLSASTASFPLNPVNSFRWAIIDCSVNTSASSSLPNSELCRSRQQ